MDIIKVYQAACDQFKKRVYLAYHLQEKSKD